MLVLRNARTHQVLFPRSAVMWVLFQSPVLAHCIAWCSIRGTLNESCLITKTALKGYYWTKMRPGLLSAGQSIHQRRESVHTDTRSFRVASQRKVNSVASNMLFPHLQASRMTFKEHILVAVQKTLGPAILRQIFLSHKMNHRLSHKISSFVN